METDPFQIITFLQLVFLPLTTGSILGIAVVIVLLFCSALISGSEVAFFSLTPNELNALVEKKSKGSKLVLKLLKKPEALLANILISNNFINVGIVILGSSITNSLMDFTLAPILGFVIQVISITFLLLLFGEIMPKIYADRFSKSFAINMAFPIYYLGKFFKPLIILLTKSTKAVNSKLAKRRQNISMDELSKALDLTTGVYKEEKRMLEGIVKFSNLETSEIMKPRTDVTDVDINTDMKGLIKVIMDSGYSRIPVYENTADNVKGILYVKDLLPYLKKPKFKWERLIRPPYFVPETKKINDLLLEFQKMKIHLAIVVDEYGGTEGIVTMEDILEEVVGEITDESDEAEDFYERLSPDTYLFDGKTLLNDFFKVTGLVGEVLEDVRGEAETLAGLILELRGDFPKQDDILNLKNLVFTVTDMEKRRIKQIKVFIKSEEDNED